MKNLVLGIIGAVGGFAAVGLGYVLLFAMDLLRPEASRQRGINPFVPADPRKLDPVNDGWGVWETYYILLFAIGFISVILWLKIAVRGCTPGKSANGFLARPNLVKLSFGIAILLAIVAATMVIPPVRIAVTGGLRGATFYHGFPVSYWLGRLKSEWQWKKSRADEEPLNLKWIVAHEIRKEAVPGLIEWLTDPDSNVRGGASNTLREIGPEANEATPALIDIVKNDKEPGVRFCAALALVEIGPGAKYAVPILAESLKEEITGLNIFKSDFACDALAKLGPDAKEAIPGLIEFIRKENQGNGGKAYDALRKIDPEAAKRLDAK